MIVAEGGGASRRRPRGPRRRGSPDATPVLNPFTPSAPPTAPEGSGGLLGLLEGVAEDILDVPVLGDILGYPAKVYNDLSQTTEQLPGAVMEIGRSISGESPTTPYDLLRQGVQQTIEDWSNPAQYAQEHPGTFLLDLVGMAAGGSRALTSAARRGGAASVPEFLAGERGAIGPAGRALEEGRVTDFIETPKGTGGAAGSHLGYGTATPEGSLPVLLKPEPNLNYDYRLYWDQASNEIAVNKILQEAQSPIAYPGVQAAEWLHRMPPEYSTGIGATDEVLQYRRGAAIEFDPVLEEMPYNAMADRTRNLSQLSEDIKNISLTDLMLGNSDRIPAGKYFGNIGYNPVIDRPIPFDYGGIGSELQHVFFPENLRGVALGSADIDYAQRVNQAVQKLYPELEQLMQAKDLRFITKNIQELLRQGRFPQTGAWPGNWS